MNKLSGFNALAAGFVDRDGGMVFNNQGGKDTTQNAKPYNYKRTASKVHLRNKYRSQKSKRAKSRKGKSKGKSIISKRPRGRGKSRGKGRGRGRGKGGLAPGGTNISAMPAFAGKQPPPGIAYRATRKPRRVPVMKRKGLANVTNQG